MTVRYEIRTSAILERAATILEENDWTQFSMARNWRDERVFVWDKMACKFCAMGAIRRAIYELMGSPTEGVNGWLLTRKAMFAELDLASVVGVTQRMISRWNDRAGQTRAEVVEGLRKARDLSLVMEK